MSLKTSPGQVPCCRSAYKPVPADSAGALIFDSVVLPLEQAAINKDPWDLPSLQNFALTLERLGKREEAQAAWDRLRQRATDSQNIFWVLYAMMARAGQGWVW